MLGLSIHISFLELFCETSVITQVRGPILASSLKLGFDIVRSRDLYSYLYIWGRGKCM